VKGPRTSLTMRGPVPRAPMLAANLDPCGYHMLRDEGTLALSDSHLFGFYAEALGARPAGAANASGHGPRGSASIWEALTAR
jgi:hypothetical protein